MVDHRPYQNRTLASHDERVMADQIHPQAHRLGIALFASGLLIALGAALLLVLGVIESGWAAAIGMIGIGLIATSQFAARMGSSQR
jgi:hypothetical protein